MSSTRQRFVFEEKHLGTPVRLVIIGEKTGSGAEVPPELNALVRDAYLECARIEKKYSRFLENNALAMLNAHVGEWTPVDAEFYSLLASAEEVKCRTEGAFDLSVKTLLEGWGYDSDYSFVEKMAGTVGPMALRTDEDGKGAASGGFVRLSAPIELGGIGKGYAIDRIASILEPLKHFLVDAGGDLRLSGSDEALAPWRVAFEHPTETTQAIGLFEGSDLALACSSPSRRQWKNRHHLVDPRTREPAMGMLAVYTQMDPAKDPRAALVADTYSTALFVLGFDRARELLPELPIEALLVSPRGEFFRTKGFRGKIFTE